MYTITYKIDNQQRPTVSTWNYIQYPIINHNGNDDLFILLYITESLCCIPETNMTLQINFTSIWQKKYSLNSLSVLIVHYIKWPS